MAEAEGDRLDTPAGATGVTAGAAAAAAAAAAGGAVAAAAAAVAVAEADCGRPAVRAERVEPSAVRGRPKERVRLLWIEEPAAEPPASPSPSPRTARLEPPSPSPPRPWEMVTAAGDGSGAEAAEEAGIEVRCGATGAVARERAGRASSCCCCCCLNIM
jgi:hypothetical protein